MGMLERFGDIMSANINALFDRWEDPAKMSDQYLRKMRDALADVRKETAGVMAQETSTLNLYNKIKGQVDEQTAFATKAVQAGNDDDARVFLAKKNALLGDLASAEQAYLVAKSNASKYRQMHDKLVKDIQELDSRRGIIKAKAAVAKTQETINKVGAGSSDYGATAGRLADLESRVDDRLNRAMAEGELMTTPVDETAELAKKYGPAGSLSVDDELAEMKRNLGM